MKFSPEEREVTINFNDGDPTAYIYTRVGKWWRDLERKGFTPTRIYRNNKGKIYAKEFEVGKNLVRVRKPPGKPQKAFSRQSHS